MEIKALKKEVNHIEMPKKMQEQIIQNCYRRMEVTKVKNTSKKLYIKPMVAVATTALCLCVTGITAMASTGKLQGFFKDIKNWTGAVVGTTYEQASDEVKLSVSMEGDELAVMIKAMNPKMAPYSFFETIGIEKYQILNADGNLVAEGTTEKVEVSDGVVTVKIPLGDIANGEYKLVVTQLVGGAKAEQPLILNGNWACKFTK